VSRSTIIASPLGDQQRSIVVKADRAFYDFWNTGNETALKQAIAAAIAPIRMVGHGDTGAIAPLAPYLFAGANIAVGLIAL
jgi:hypothetical protein